MQEARASWNTVYLDSHGFECQLTLRDDDEEALAKRATGSLQRILDRGGKPFPRRRGLPNGEANGNGGSAAGSAPATGTQEKTYVDERGVRRCNLPLRTGRRCGQPVVEKEGKYGRFWSCPSYKEHAPPPSQP